jgi:arginyl-tRNA--protein-N-Asp/Glu arginylyltransferase
MQQNRKKQKLIQQNIKQQMEQNQADNNCNVIFRVSGKGIGAPQITIQCQANERISSLINKYRTKSGDSEQKKRFIFNAKALNPTLTAAESGLSNNSTIYVINLKGLEGARF